jgi:hypothetical protein
MEACQCAEFTDGAELAALVEKGVVGPCTREARGGREARWRGRKTGLLCSGAEEILAGGARRCDEEGGAVESIVAEAARQSMVTESCHGTTREVSFFPFLERLGASG